MIGWLVNKVYESLFLASDTGIRRAHILAKAMLIILVVYGVSRGLTSSIIALLVLVTLMYFGGLKNSIKSMLIVSSIPALWLSISGWLTAYITAHDAGPIILFSIYVRSLTFSLAILFLIASLSPYELSRIMWLTGLERYSIAPLLLWRLTPVMLRDVVDAYSVQRVKGEKLWKSIAISTAAILEHRRFLVEYGYFKLSCRLLKPVPYDYKLNNTVIVIVAGLAILVTCLVL